MSSFLHQRIFLCRPDNGTLPLHLHQRSTLPCPIPVLIRVAIFTTMIGVLVPFIAMKYENKTFTPFDTHPKTTNALIFNVFVFGISFIVEATIMNGAVDSIFVLVAGHISDLSLAFEAALVSSIILPVSVVWLSYSVFIYLLVRLFSSFVDILKEWVCVEVRKALQWVFKFLCLMTRIPNGYLGPQRRDSSMLPISITT